ncbi:hypothetical protein [Hansschlegelia beijingensis]|uniref:Uncharacterized protein n=1 Tax=Hansschlegelia beijingensis TaxID=1133344 RepID=A0A7W6CWY7_9HYPH|nr:hypothetical protein [Hansschlegelia beijingensis]MBB3972621.1 hypothetical protein [Hansschlegelia beijingensis]
MMKRITLAAAASALMIGGAFAQTEMKQPQEPSTIDKGSATGSENTTPKTTGAMNKVAPDVATNPQEIQKQQADQDARRGGGAEKPHDQSK